MFVFILRRLIQAMIVMVAVAFIAFMLFQYVGDPVVFLLGQDARPDQINQLRIDLGLDQPFFIQFWHFLQNAVQGEFGLSLRQGAKVSRLITERLPATLELALFAGVLALLVGVPFGVYAALKRGQFFSQLLMTKRWWGGEGATPLTSIYDGSSTSAFLTGLMWMALYQECPQAEYTGIAMEYGTLPIEQMIQALRAEHWLNKHPEASRELALEIKQQMMDAFYVNTDEWKLQIISQAQQSLIQAVNGLSE